MLIQSNECYKLDVAVQWLDPEQIQVKITRSNFDRGQWEHRYQSLFLAPTELATLADYINDTLAR